MREGTSIELSETPELIAESNAVPSLQLCDLQRALAKLPTEQREVILLVGLEGMAYEEIATVLNVPVGTVHSRLSRGRDQLRRLRMLRRVPRQSSGRERLSILPFCRHSRGRLPTRTAFHALRGSARAQPSHWQS